MIPAIPELPSLNAKPKAERGPGALAPLEGETRSLGAESGDIGIGFDDLVESVLRHGEVDTPASESTNPVVETGAATPGSSAPSGNDVPASGKELPKTGNSVPPPLRETDSKAKLNDHAAAQSRSAKTAAANRSADAPAWDLPRRDPAPQHVAVDAKLSLQEGPRSIRPPLEETAVREKETALQGTPQTLKDSTGGPIIREAASTSSELDSDPSSSPLADVTAEPQRPPNADETRPVAAPLSPSHHRADEHIPHEAIRVAGTSRQGERETVSRLRDDRNTGPKAIGDRLSGTSAKPEALPPASGATSTPMTQLTVDPVQSVQSQPASSFAPNAIAPSVSTPLNSLAPLAEARVEARVIPQIEQAIDALTDAREAGRASRPEMVLRHGEFGMVNLRLEAANGDLRATLANRDPGFVPAVQAALGDRAASASNDTAGNHNQQRGQEQGSASFAGSGSGNPANYGSSTGSSQGSSQPRLPQQELTQQDADSGDRTGTGETPQAGAGSSGLFA